MNHVETDGEEQEDEEDDGEEEAYKSWVCDLQMFLVAFHSW